MRFIHWVIEWMEDEEKDVHCREMVHGRSRRHKCLWHQGHRVWLSELDPPTSTDTETVITHLKQTTQQEGLNTDLAGMDKKWRKKMGDILQGCFWDSEWSQRWGFSFGHWWEGPFCRMWHCNGSAQNPQTRPWKTTLAASTLNWFPCHLLADEKKKNIVEGSLLCYCCLWSETKTQCSCEHCATTATVSSSIHHSPLLSSTINY